MNGSIAGWLGCRSVPPPYITTAGLYASKYYHSARAPTLVKTILQLSPDALLSPANTRHTRPGSIGESAFAFAKQVSFVLLFSLKIVQFGVTMILKKTIQFMADCKQKSWWRGRGNVVIIISAFYAGKEVG